MRPYDEPKLQNYLQRDTFGTCRGLSLFLTSIFSQFFTLFSLFPFSFSIVCNLRHTFRFAKLLAIYTNYRNVWLTCMNVIVSNLLFICMKIIYLSWSLVCRLCMEIIYFCRFRFFFRFIRLFLIYLHVSSSRSENHGDQKNENKMYTVFNSACAWNIYLL